MCVSGVELQGIVDAREALRPRGCVAAGSWLKADSEGSGMAVPSLDSERTRLSDPEKEDIWVRLNPSPPATFSQAVVLEVKRCHGKPAGAGVGKEANAGEGEGEGTSSLVCPQHEGGVQLEDQTTPFGSTAEEDLRRSWIPEQGGGEAGRPCGSPEDSSAVCGPEPAWLSSAAKEQAIGASLAPTSVGEETCRMGAGEELPLLETEHVSLLEGRLLGSGEQEVAGQPCRILVEDASGDEQECPICTEPYDHDQRRPALLNCSHVLCGRCLRSIMEVATTADIGRVRCPICRQKTPMMEWEICKLQEELLLLNLEQSPTSAPPAFNALPVRRPGVWGALEHHFQMRFHTTRMIGFLPCLRYPPCLISNLERLERRCRWGYRLALVALLVGEMLSLLLIFLPIVLLLLLFLILDR